VHLGVPDADGVAGLWFLAVVDVEQIPWPHLELPVVRRIRRIRRIVVPPDILDLEAASEGGDVDLAAGRGEGDGAEGVVGLVLAVLLEGGADSLVNVVGAPAGVGGILEARLHAVADGGQVVAGLGDHLGLGEAVGGLELGADAVADVVQG